MFILPSFFENDATDVAPLLLGCTFVRRLPDGSFFRAIVSEIEAYMPDDPACHAFRGPTPRTQIMFGDPGIAYIYLIYGMYHCLNVVTGPKGSGQAILIRGLLPLDNCGNVVESQIKKFGGPGKICRELAIDKKLNGTEFTPENSMWFEDRSSGGLKYFDHTTSPRIGIRVGVDKLWRWKLNTFETR